MYLKNLTAIWIYLLICNYRNVILNKIFLGINWKGYSSSLIGNVQLEEKIGTNVQQGNNCTSPKG